MKVTIELDGPSTEVEGWMSRFSLSDDLATNAVAENADEDDQGWSPQVADRLVNRITPDAQKALRFLMENEPEVFFEDLQGHLGLDGISTGGVMASFGFAVNAGLPRPYKVDRARRRYVIDPEVAPILLEALERYETRHGRTA